MSMWIIELQPGVWRAPWPGDPGRTLVENKAKRYSSEFRAKIALGLAREYYEFRDARIYQVEE